MSSSKTPSYDATSSHTGPLPLLRPEKNCQGMG